MFYLKKNLRQKKKTVFSSDDGMIKTFQKRGKRRHYCFQKMLKVKLHTVKDLDTKNLLFVKSLQNKLREILSNVRDKQTPIFVFNEVPFSGFDKKPNRRVDTLIYVQNEAVISVEYKTTESSKDFKSKYITQINDTTQNINRAIFAAVVDPKYVKLNEKKPIHFISLLTVRSLVNRKRTDYTNTISETSVPNLRYKLLFESKLFGRGRRSLKLKK